VVSELGRIKRAALAGKLGGARECRDCGGLLDDKRLVEVKQQRRRHLAQFSSVCG
jgi:hypothetical protein